MNSNVIQIESLNHMSFDDLISLYRQGYKLEERNFIGLNRSLNGNFEVRSLATCPGTITTGGTLTLSATASSGTSPYKYNWTVRKPDGVLQTLTDQATNSYTFATDGNYDISVNITDSCSAANGGPRTSPTQACTIKAVPAGTVKWKCTDPATSTCSSGTDSTYIFADQASCKAAAACQPGGDGGGGVTGCTEANCPSATNYCIVGQCISKKTALYGGAAVGVLVLIMALK